MKAEAFRTDLEPASAPRHKPSAEAVTSWRELKVQTIDLELSLAEAEVRELEARLRAVPMNDTALADALQRALTAKRERLSKLKHRRVAS
jgi:hypothetical protein